MYKEGIVVLDFGGLEGRALARRVRGEQVFCTILPISAPIDEIRAHSPRGIIIAGDDRDATKEQARSIPSAVYELGLPILGIGCGARTVLREAGATLKSSRYSVAAMQVKFDDVPLFHGLTTSDRAFDRLDDIDLPDGYISTAATDDGCCVAFECPQRRIWGMQFCPEPNDPDGLQILRNFARGISGAEPEWKMQTFLDWSLNEIREAVGDGQALSVISGGVDTAVCAALMHRAVGDKLVCMHVDTGLMREGERELVQHFFDEQGIDLRVIAAADRFMAALSGLSDSGQKRDAVYREYGRAMQQAIAELGEGAVVAQGTIYTDTLDEPDVWATPDGTVIEPLRMLFKDEVRELGALLGLPSELVNRQAFPGPGLALRCLGEATPEKIAMVRKADHILHEEIAKSGLDKRVRQYFAVLTDTRTRGHNGCGYAVAIRAVNPAGTMRALVFRMPYDALERVCERIVTEVPGVNRVVYDVTSAPPSLVEWE